MENARHAVVFHVVNESRPHFALLEAKVVHVADVFASLGDVRPRDVVFVCPRGEVGMVAIPDRNSLGIDRVGAL